MSTATPVQRLDTPVLLVDYYILNANIDKMVDIARSNDVNLRPHVKTHKTPEIAEMQVESGAAGITVAKVSEAEVMAKAGHEDIFIANQIVGKPKFCRVAHLILSGTKVALGVDTLDGLTQLEEGIAGQEVEVEVLIEVDTGNDRCGVRENGELLELAKRASRSSGVELKGLFTHEGHVYGQDSREGVRRASLSAGQFMVKKAKFLREKGFDVPVVSVGSTVSAPYTPTVEGVTEMRPGTYVFNDMMQVCLGSSPLEGCALTVHSSFISVRGQNKGVLDAGSKTLFSDEVHSCFDRKYWGSGYIKEYPAARINSLSEEHGVVDLTEVDDRPKVGEKVHVIPNHVCPVVNMQDRLFVESEGQMKDVWRIQARGAVT